MKKFLLLFTLLGLGQMAMGQNILLWDNDNASHFDNPDNPGYIIGSEHGLRKAVSSNGYSCEYAYDLPADLSQYDLVFVALGLWCSG